MQTLSRYLSNTFSDAEKQNTINLFLGLFIPDVTRPPLWEYTTDYYLHHLDAIKYKPIKNQRYVKILFVLSTLFLNFDYFTVHP